ncbi:Zinc ion binding protein [Heracleum sosnowskyi]|uniref:Zinc ion binding protein n=1 Tax=Heracleum sosnowskyi TaxID=360622 RepID=A0AAD8HXK3_9APIA|nr:Zinc ion binding protein [Heracleum sosnowskyi]
MKETSEENLPEEAVGEDWCFSCYEGGELRICDYKGCSKSYHTYCVDKDDSFLEDESEWFCDSHTCYRCGKSSNVHCLGCPKSVCWHCIAESEVVATKGGKGFCSKCLNLAIMIEEDKSYDSEGNHVDFNDLRTDEGLFKEYWEIINKEEGVTLGTLHSADLKMRKGNTRKKVNKRKKRNRKQSTHDLDKHYECEETEISDYDDSCYAKKRKSNQKLGQSKNPSTKRKVPKPEFIGWGSKTLVKFLESINVDVSESLSPRNVASIVNRYIRDKKLFHPDKKKQVVCDANLQSLFGRKTLNKHKISHYLDSHFAENQQSSEDDEIVDVSEDENSLVGKRQMRRSENRKVSEDEKSVVAKRQKNMSECTKFEEPGRFRRPQCHYASICRDNINLVYLKKTLVQKLLEEPDTFGAKLTGSFVKVKSDPNDYLQTKPHQLMQVTGTTRDSTDENNMKVLLKVSGSTKPISINSLLESDITEEDCEGLRECIKSGLLKQPTIAALKEKTIDLHEERMKHWIARELKLLQNRIDQANEKGWRRELYEYWEEQEKLQSSKEHLLKHIPDVIAADISELAYMPEGIIDYKEEDDCSHKSGSEKEHQRSVAYQCSPCTPTKKQNIYRKSLEEMGVHIVDLTSDVHGKTKNAATQTQELED